MGKFLNTSYFDTVDSLVKMNSDLIQNPFYLFNDKNECKVKYYNINNEKSTLDPGSKLAYTDIGSNSPIRFNVINDLYLYQFSKLELNFDNGEFGLESSEFEGESYILPNTIIPTDGDFFEVDHIKDSTWLFKVNNVQRDTLENGYNVYKISWILDRTTNRDILENVVEEYKYVPTVEGSNLKSVIKLEKYDIAKQLDNLYVNLIEYFKELFYDKRVQTFIYKWYNEYNMYDPFLIEFIIRNRLLENTESFVFVDHKCSIPRTFTIDYNKSIFKVFEDHDKDKLRGCHYTSQADYIDDTTSVFKTRYEMFFKLNYNVILEENGPFNPKGIIPIMEEELIENIMTNKLYDNITGHKYNNIIVKFFNNQDLELSDVEDIQTLDLESSKYVCYHLIFIIYCLDYYIKKLMS